ncbi:hypothetical protein ANANG_G00123150 [Anguilla anguilla]|uniref:Uncharacterized protein n=1 Tax=Anguilla anguilla TaxID=7936 RepID=A0A9D3S1T0_ANGAN|nr:hypothetical protein ANANG_G00123150 [Anguilla anguilla]
MGSVPLCLLLSLTALGVALPEDGDEYTWPHGKVPLVRSERTVRLSRPAFGGKPQGELRGACAIECQSVLPRPDAADLERLLSYETVYENGSRTLTRVSVRGLAEDAPPERLAPAPEEGGLRHGQPLHHLRPAVLHQLPLLHHRQALHGLLRDPGLAQARADGRPLHTRRERLPEGRQEAARGAPEAPLQTERGTQERPEEGRRPERGGEGGGERRAGGKRRAGGEGRARGEGRTRGEGGREGKGGKRRGRKSRSRRSAEAKKPTFRWTRVKQTQVPQGWLKGPSGKAEVAVDYDYALLEMKRPHRQKFMDLGVVPSVRELPAGRVHFSGFDDDRAGQLVYRFCSVTEESGDLLYQQCDSRPGAGGSGIYVRLKEPGKRKWTRKIVGVFSGHHWVDVNGAQQDYNVGVRITPEKYAQICLWVHGNSEECRSA